MRQGLRRQVSNGKSRIKRLAGELDESQGEVHALQKKDKALADKNAEVAKVKKEGSAEAADQQGATPTPKKPGGHPVTLFLPSWHSCCC